MLYRLSINCLDNSSRSLGDQFLWLARKSHREKSDSRDIRWVLARLATVVLTSFARRSWATALPIA